MKTNINEKTTVLKISGNVIPTPGKLRSSISILSSSTNMVNFNSIYKGQEDNQTIDIKNTHEKTIEISIFEIPDYLEIEIENTKIAPGESSKMHVALLTDKINTYGKFKHLQKLELSLADNKYSGNITIIANVSEDFSHLTPQDSANAPKIFFPIKSKILGNVSKEKNQIVTFEFQNTGKSELSIHNIQLNNNTFVLVEYDKYIKTGAKGNIVLQLTDNNKNSLNTSFTVISNDPVNSASILQIIGSHQKEKSVIKSNSSDYKNIDLQEAMELIKKYDGSEKLVILDVRTPGEYKEGFIPGALNFDFEILEFKKYLSIFDKNKIYLVYCSIGKRSSETVLLMNEIGFENIYHIADGFDGWQQKRLPIKYLEQ